MILNQDSNIPKQLPINSEKRGKVNKEEIKDMVDNLVRMSSQKSESGNWHVSYDELSQLYGISKEELLKNHETIIEEIDAHRLILSETYTDTDENGNPNGYDMNFCWNDIRNLPVWNRNETAVNLLEQDIRCCGEIIEENDCLSFTYELWFDVDRYFGTNTIDDDGTWINFYTYFYPETEQVEAVMCITMVVTSEIYSWQLIDDEKNFLLELMKSYADKQEH